MQSLSVAETLAAAMERREPLRPILEAFAPLTELRVSVPVTLSDAVARSGFRFPNWDDERGQSGEPLLFGTLSGGRSAASPADEGAGEGANAPAASPAGPAEGDAQGAGFDALSRPLQQSARLFAPVFAALPFLAPHAEAFAALGEDEAALLAASRAYLKGDVEELEARAQAVALPSGVLSLVLEAVVGAVLRAAVRLQFPESLEWAAPWDERPASWGRGWCPVCGSAPVVAWLEEKGFDHKNPFAAGGGGKKHLHCGLCGTEWRFRRGACPSCDSEGADVMEVLRESEHSFGERLDWCTRCQSYCPAVDLRERDTRPDMDALALSLMHLDMVAADKGLSPLYPTFWNQH